MFPHVRRPSRDQMLMAMAFEVSRRATCQRARVGAVIAHESRSVMAGYNGTPPGMDHCNHASTDDTPCADAVHAEANAIAHAARHGVSVLGATIYVTHAPCYGCAQLIISAGIVRVVYATGYRDRRGVVLLRTANVEIVIL